MSVQFIADSTGETTGVFIPIDDWNEIKNKYQGIEEQEADVPAWHQDIVKGRLNDTSSALDFKQAIQDIRRSL